MSTADISSVLAIIRTILFLIVILLCLIYSIPIIFIRRFRHRKNILTFNICLAIISCCISYTIFFIIYDYHLELMLIDSTCNWLTYMRLVSACQVSFALITVSLNRFILMLYSSKAFFQKKQWIIICIICQWTAGFIVSLPTWTRNNPYCFIPQWILIYMLVISIILPACLCLIVNLRIFIVLHFLSCQVQSTVDQIPTQQQQQRHRHDIRLLLHTIFMFCIIILGWSPVFILSIIDDNRIPVFIYSILIILAELSFVCVVISLFFYNRTLRQYLKNKIFCCSPF